MSSPYYPESEMPIAGEHGKRYDDTLAETYERFCAVREHILLDYGYNTARAYWGDLDDVFLWAAQREKNIFTLTEKDIRQYIALLRRRKYSENTIRRRVTALRKFYDAAVDSVKCPRVRTNPALDVVVSGRSTFKQ